MMINSRQYRYGQHQLAKQYATRRRDLPVNFGQLLREPMYLNKVWRISEHQAIGYVRHFSMGDEFYVHMDNHDLKLLSFAQGITIGIGSVWQPEKPIDCELRQYRTAGEYTAFYGLDWVQDTGRTVAQRHSFIVDTLKTHHKLQKLCTVHDSYQVVSGKVEYHIKIECHEKQQATLERYVNPYSNGITIRWQTVKPFYGTFSTDEPQQKISTQRTQEQAA